MAPAVMRQNPNARTKVLLIDDDADSRDVLKIILETDGQDVAIADDGDEGIELARTFRPHVAFVDIQMPRVDGYTVARTMRRELGSEVWLVAVTGRPADMASEAAGFDFHYTKPIALDEVRTMVRAVRLGLGPAVPAH